MFFSNRDRFKERPRRNSLDGRETSLFLPPTCLSPKGAPRIVDEWVDHAEIEAQRPLDGRSYNVTGNLLNPNKGKSMTPRRSVFFEDQSKKDVPGPASYTVHAPPLLKPTFNRCKFTPVLPDSPYKRQAAPRFKGAYQSVSLSPRQGDDSPSPNRHNPYPDPYLTTSPPTSPGMDHTHTHAPAAYAALSSPSGHSPSQSPSRSPDKPAAPFSLASSLDDVLIPGKPISKMKDIKIQLARLKNIIGMKKDRG